MEKTSERLARALGPPSKNTVKWVVLYSDSRQGAIQIEKYPLTARQLKCC
jgi:hypothetical protein